MAEHLLRVTLAAASGVTADDIVNDFSCDLPAGFTAAENAVEAFYNTNGAGPIARVAYFIGRTMSRVADACRFDWYPVDTAGKLAGTDPLGSPVASTQWTLATAGAAGDLPGECAVAISMHADYTGAVEDGPGTTRPRARRRGRVFIGPLIRDAATFADGVPPRPEPNLIDSFVFCAARLRDDVDVGLSVWSRADAIFRPVTVVSVDDAMDTIRSRGVDMSARTSDP